MYIWPLILALAAAPLYAADETLVALATKADATFERVLLSADPQLPEAAGCVQAQAALLPVSSADELPRVHFRKGYCHLAVASVTRNTEEFASAAAEFDKAAEAWRNRPLKSKVAEPVPSALPAASAVARLLSGAAGDVAARAESEIVAAQTNRTCISGLMTQPLCEDILRTAGQWLGRFSLDRGRLNDAAIAFAATPGSGWSEWVVGQEAFQAGRYREAAVSYRRAIDLLHPDAPQRLLRRLGPPSDKASELEQLGGALLLAGDPRGSIAVLDSAVKANPANARALYLRARAKEAAGQSDAALADYNLASRTAFANSRDLASGEAHLYRGVLLFRRKDYTHAEDEFSSALNFTISEPMRADAEAWRHLAAVAAGSCGASRQFLTRSLSTASPYFPRDEARNVMASCPASTASVSAPVPAPK